MEASQKQQSLNFTPPSPFVQDFNLYRETGIGSKAEEFHNANPHVYEMVKKFALQVQARGYKKFSINAIFERVRWETNIETTDKQFKISNNHRAYYARRLMAMEPKFQGFFATQEIS